MDDAEFYRWYGPWDPLTPGEAAELLAGMSAPWWVAGGWAIDAFTGRRREHEDIDIAFFRDDLPAVLDHLLAGYCVWSNHGGTMRPLRSPGELLDGCRQLWVRRDGAGPWLADLLLTPHDGDTWISVRDECHRRPLVEAVFAGDSDIRYLRPEIVLHLKARLRRPKDDEDLAAALPTLAPEARGWLRDAVAREDPGHPWLPRLEAGG